LNALSRLININAQPLLRWHCPKQVLPNASGKVYFFEGAAMRHASIIRSLGLFFLSTLAAVTIAGPITYGNPFADYGRVQNTSCGGQNGICGAAEAINSFAFLRNYYPAAYGTTNLTTGTRSGATAMDEAAKDFAVRGWTINGVNYDGYYPRTGGVNVDYVTTLSDWTKSFAPGTRTWIEAIYGGNTGPGDSGNPTFDFLIDEMRDHSAVQLFIFNGAGLGHVLSLISASFAFDPELGCLGSNCSISFQDPNDPNSLYTEIVSVSNGFLGFTMPLTFTGEFVTITAAFSESVPEPSSAVLVVLGLAGLYFNRRKRDWSKQHP